MDTFVAVVAGLGTISGILFAVKTYTTSTDMPSTDPNVPKVTVNASRYIPNKTDRIVVIAGGSQHFTRGLDSNDNGQAGAVYKYYFQTTSGKPNWQAVDSFRLQDGGWIIQKCSTYPDKVFFFIVSPRGPTNTRWEMLSDILISGLNALSAYDGVIRMPLVGNGIYGTGDKMSDTMNATKAITKAARASGREVVVYTDTQ
jgi:hypothetical protein